MEKKFLTSIILTSLLIISISSLSGCAKSQIRERGKNEEIRVALGHKISKIMISSSSGIKISTPDRGILLRKKDTLFIEYDNIEFKMYLNRNKRIKTNALPVYFTPLNRGMFTYNGMIYRGKLIVKKDADEFLLAINQLSMEDYLKGVVPAEIGKLNIKMIEASKAQAIAARTYAFAHLRKHSDMGYDIECTVQDQVYMGYFLEDSMTNRAIEETKGIIAFYKNLPIDAKYHSTCGGYTSNNENEWGGEPVPYLRGTFDGEGCLFKKVYCSKSKHYKWSYEYSKDDFYNMISRNYSNLKKNNIKAVDVYVSKRDKYKRVVEMTIKDKSGNKYTVKGFDIRKMFTFEEHLGGILKSRNFTIDRKGKKIIINGGGYGHGVGMCQYGAMEMANSGKNYKQILTHYYKGIQLKKIY